MSTAVQIPAGGCVLDADLTKPDASVGVVAFAHGTGSSRHSPRNREVATVLQDAGLATLLADLLTPEEEQADLRTGHGLLVLERPVHLLHMLRHHVVDQGVSGELLI